MSVTRRSFMTTSLAALTSSFAACKSGKESKNAGKSDEDAAEKRLVKVPLIIHATRDSNDGRPLHVVVREVTREAFVEDDYAKVARLVVAPDRTVRCRQVVFPGQAYELSLTFKKQPEAIGVYGLFTLESKSWKVLAEYPREIEMWAGPSTLENVRVEDVDL